MLTLADVERAASIVGAHFEPTPLYAWPLLGAQLGVETWVKHEDATPIGAFKLRGGLVYLERLARDRPQVTRVVSATRGNHGQSLAYAARVFGRRATIVVPHGNSVDKNAAMAALGADVVVHGIDFQEALEHAAALASADDSELVPPFHPDLVAGVATYGMELLTALPTVRTVYVPVGMGSGISGLIAVRDLLGHPAEIVGVCAENAPATALSFAAGVPVSTASSATFVDGVATRAPDAAAVAIMVAGAARILTVSEAAAADAVRVLYRCTHHLAEPAGALALAGALQERHRPPDGPIALVLSGGNMDAPMAATLLSGGTPRP